MDHTDFLPPAATLRGRLSKLSDPQLDAYCATVALSGAEQAVAAAANELCRRYFARAGQ